MKAENKGFDEGALSVPARDMTGGRNLNDLVSARKLSVYSGVERIPERGVAP
jgi:hypothetical protein